MRARYELVDAGTDNPEIQGYYSIGVIQAAASGSTWGSSYWGTGTWGEASETGEFVLMSGSAPEDDGRDPFVWFVNRRARYIRFRLQSTDPAARMVLRGLEVFIRPAANDR